MCLEDNPWQPMWEVCAPAEVQAFHAYNSRDPLKGMGAHPVCVLRIWVVLASVQRRLFSKYYGFEAAGMLGEVIKLVNSTLKMFVSQKAADLCSVSE